MTPAFAGAGLYGAFDVKRFFPPLSVAAVAAWRIDRLQLREIELSDGLKLVSQSRSFEVIRQVVEPSAVFVLQIDQRRHGCRPPPWPWRDASRRRCGRCVVLLAQPGAVSRLALGGGHRYGADAISGHARLSLSIVTVTFSKGLQRSAKSCNQPSFFVRSRTVSPSRPGHCEGVARSRGQDWPKATAEGAREAVLTAGSTTPDLAGSGRSAIMRPWPRRAR